MTSRPRHAPERAVAIGLLLGLLIGGGCAEDAVVGGRRSLGGMKAGAPGSSGYQPNRRDYASFREAHPDLLEPNYLPFMAHRFERNRVAGDAMIFCRWDAEQMPIAVHIDAPAIPDSIQNEFSPRSAAEYVAAVEAALDVWEEALEGAVRFRLVASREQADLRVELEPSHAPTPVPERQVLGGAPRLAEACRTHGWDADAERMQVRFSLPSLTLYLADEMGLLPPYSIRRLALHELGHALGMRGHSPSPGDLMYPVLGDDRQRDSLSEQDVNSFLTLYRIPNGAHLVDVPPPGSGLPPPPPPPVPPALEPGLEMAPYVDARHGYEISLPAHWVRIQEPHGLFATDGPSWDYYASLRIFVWPASGIDDFLRCCFRGLLAGSWFRHRESMLFMGRPALQLRFEDPTATLDQDYLFIDLGDGRVMMVATESPVDHHAEWEPWFQVSLNTLEIWQKGAGPSRRFPSGRGGARDPARAPREVER